MGRNSLDFSSFRRTFIFRKDLFLSCRSQIGQVLSHLAGSFSRHGQSWSFLRHRSFCHICGQFLAFSMRTCLLQIRTTFLVHWLFGGAERLSIRSWIAARCVICRTGYHLIIIWGRAWMMSCAVTFPLYWTRTHYFSRQSCAMALDSRSVYRILPWRYLLLRWIENLTRLSQLVGVHILCIFVQKLRLLVRYREIVDLKWSNFVFGSVRRLFMLCEEECIRWFLRSLSPHLFQLDCLDWRARRRVLSMNLWLVMTHGEASCGKKRPSLFRMSYMIRMEICGEGGLNWEHFLGFSSRNYLLFLLGNALSHQSQLHPFFFILQAIFETFVGVFWNFIGGRGLVFGWWNPGGDLLCGCRRNGIGLFSTLRSIIHD